MAYTKTGPFVDNALPAISAGFLNGVESALVAAPTTVGSGTTAAGGGTFTVTVGQLSGGFLLISGTAGGAWTSVWAGIYAADTARVDVTQLGADFTTPGNLITSVAGSATDRTITVTYASTGATGIYKYTIFGAGGG